MLDDYEMITEMTQRCSDVLHAFKLENEYGDLLFSFCQLANAFIAMTEGAPEDDHLPAEDIEYNMKAYARDYAKKFMKHEELLREIDAKIKIMCNVLQKNV